MRNAKLRKEWATRVATFMLGIAPILVNDIIINANPVTEIIIPEVIKAKFCS